MTTALIQLLAVIIPVLIKEAPAAIAAIKDLLNKQEATEADWKALVKYAPDYESFGINPPQK